MTTATELANAGCASGTVVVANEQTAGQGRHGHTWLSEAGCGLYLSEVLRLSIGADTLPVVTLALGLAVAEAIAAVAGLACDLRWPNDVLLDGKKCAGILAQLQGKTLIAGIGINVNHGCFPPELAHIATSLRIESAGRKFSINQLLQYLIGAIDRTLEILLKEGTEAILRSFTEASSFVRGRRVTVEHADGPKRGITDGLDAKGFLYLREDNGKRTLILAGGVRPECS